MESIYKPSNLYETLKINYKEELKERSERWTSDSEWTDRRSLS